MKTVRQSILFVALLTFVTGGICLSMTDLATAQDLSSNIMRHVNEANDFLDKAEEQIRTGKEEHAPRQLKGAQKQYDEIFSFFKGSFDPEHPTITALKQRIASVEAQISGAEAPAAVQTPSSSSTANSNDLSANIRRHINEADIKLEYVNQSTKTGNRDIRSLQFAKASYENIFEYYKGTFDPNHPDIIALKERIDQAEQAMNAAYAERMGQ